MTTEAPYERGFGPLRVVVYDFGVKETMLRTLSELATVIVVPASFPAAETLALQPDGVLLSNGPGDPAALGEIAGTVDELLGKGPSSGSASATSCSGAALGGRTFKLAFGHHGGNHPVRQQATGQVEITSQNHNYALEADSLPATGTAATEVTHVNLNDGVVEGIACRAPFGLRRPVPPRGRPRPARRPVPVHEVPSLDGANHLMPRRDDIETDTRHRLGPDRDRPGVRVRLLGLPGLPSP